MTTRPTLTVSFDLDGVVIRNPFGAGVFPRVREHVRGAAALSGIDREQQDRIMTDAVNRIWLERMRKGDLVGAYDWDSILNEASAGLGGPAVPDIAELVEYFCGQDEMIALLPGAGEGLALLREHGARVYAMTNGYHAYQWPVLVALGIEHCFEDVLTPERLGAAKPQPGIFEAIPGLDAHVGDMLVHDVLGARAAGVTAVWLPRPMPAELADLDARGRARHPVLPALIERELTGNVYASVHPEANAETCQPDLIVADVLEAAEALLNEFAV